ncbi:MAG: class I SAM-dependent methyltransferase [Vitreoscilla sp.]|nr:class I SAM-dependent methyltransferase [Polaromonas sp.]
MPTQLHHLCARRSLLAFSLSLAIALALAASHSRAQPIDEVSFITSPDNVTLEMLNAAGVKRGDHVIALGSGDGRIVILAAKRFEATGLGVEIDPRLVELSKTNARNAGVADKADFREQDLFKTDLAPATVVTMYLLPNMNLALRPSLLALKPGTRIVTHDWDMGDWKPDRTTVVPVPNKVVGFEKSSKIHLWTVPARVDGLWCAAGLLRGASIRLTQKYQTFEGTLGWRDRTRELAGTINGTELRVPAGSSGELVLQVAANTLRITTAQGNLALAQGQTFTRAIGDSCS